MSDTIPLSPQPALSNCFSLNLSRPGHEKIIVPVQNFTIPGVSFGVAEQSTRRRNIPHPGTKFESDALSMTIVLDTSLSAYIKLRQWAVDNTTSIDGETFGTAVMFLLGTNGSPDMKIQFNEVFPIDFGSISFDATDQNAQVRTCDISFQYTSFEFKA